MVVLLSLHTGVAPNYWPPKWIKINDSTLHMTLWSETLKLNLDRQLSMPLLCSCGASFVCSAFTVPAGVLKALSKTTEARPAARPEVVIPSRCLGSAWLHNSLFAFQKCIVYHYIKSKMFTMTMTSNQQPWVKSEKSAWGTNLGIMSLYQCRNNRTGSKEQRTTPNEEQNPWCSKQWKTHPKGWEIMRNWWSYLTSCLAKQSEWNHFLPIVFRYNRNFQIKLAWSKL